MAKKVTLDKIAELADVSKTTVSRVLNNKPDVDDATRSKILSLMDEYGYQPRGKRAKDGSAAPARRKTYVIALLFLLGPDSFFSNPFYSDVMKGILSHLNERGYYLMFSSLKNGRFENLYEKGLVDGYIVVSPGKRHLPIIEELIAKEVPFVCTSDLDIDIPYVDVDNERGGYDMTNYLISQGHRRILFIGFDGILSSTQRLTGFRNSMAEHNIPVDERLILTIPQNNKSMAFNAFVRAMSSQKPPTAAFLCHDIIAIDGISAADALGLRVPEDISIAGFDGIDLSANTVPPLTTISQPATEKGYVAAKMLIDYLGQNAPLHPVILEHSLVIRNSTGMVSEDK